MIGTKAMNQYLNREIKLDDRHYDDAAAETTWSMKIGTVVAIILAIIGMAMGGMATWTGYISSKVATHGEEIAAIKMNNINILSTMTRMESILDDVRNDQIRRQVKEKHNDTR